MKDTLSVTEVTEYIRSLVDADDVLSSAAVSGEISNFKPAVSGHIYFSLKDAGAQLRCVMFRSAAAYLTFAPQNGDAVKVYGKISVYPRDGQYQLYVSRMVPDGAGLLFEQFERLKKQLGAEGLFDEERKRPIPRFPRRVGVITSKTGAAVRDIFSVLTRRWPSVEIVFCPASVQGAEAPGELCDALHTVAAQGNCDVIIIGRGGGSAEDLWGFNDERLVRAIAACPVPVISAVGHETDFTLADFAADLRAPTPSAAAELAVPDREELLKHTESYADRLRAALEKRIGDARQYLDTLAGRGVMQSPLGSIESRRGNVANLSRLLAASMQRVAAEKKNGVASLAAALNAMSPLNVLDRGYLLASDPAGRIVTASDLAAGDRIDLRFADGEASATVNAVHRKTEDQANG